MAKIYISSTYNDLKEYREEAYRALRKLGHDVVAMEDYTATDQRPLDKCTADIANCDIYVGIFAWRYGYIPPEQDKSITELEFRTAAAKQKTCLIFLLSDDALWAKSLIDKNSDRIDTLRKELQKEYVVEFFSNKDELGGDIAIAVSEALKKSHEKDPINSFVGERKDNKDSVKELLSIIKPIIIVIATIIIVDIFAIVAVMILHFDLVIITMLVAIIVIFGAIFAAIIYRFMKIFSVFFTTE